MRQLSEHFHCSAFLVADLPDATVTEISASSIITNCPPELIALFDQHKFLNNSPVIHRIRVSVLPFSFELKELAKERGSQAVRELFARFGMDSGAVFPVHDLSGKRGWAGLCGQGVDFSLYEMMALSYCLNHVYQQLAHLRSQDIRVSDKLVDRELACLTWTAAGKTSAEIAEILGLSEHTVNHYLNRATRKLNAVNRTQAVAKAIRGNLIV
ncbi:LuxR family transcriptional regulator [Rhizobium lemnae]|nr:LuxR family transcriptional regulator [Rhizobium lemnae]